MIPKYFGYEKKGNNIILYHGMRDESFEHLIIEEELTPKISNDAPKMIWLSNSIDYGSFTKNYPNIVSIEVPIKKFNDGTFEVKNGIDVTTLKSISLKHYKFKLLRLCNIDWEDTKENIYKVYNDNINKSINSKSKENPDDLLYGLFGTDVIVSLVKNWFYMYENYDLKHKRWNYSEWDYNKNLIL